MKIVIDIPEGFLEDLKALSNYENLTLYEKAILEGQPLPKGHGRLIDAQKLRARMYHEAFETDSEFQRWDSGCWIRYKMFEQIEETAPTIIDAEKEDNE